MRYTRPPYILATYADYAGSGFARIHRNFSTYMRTGIARCLAVGMEYPKETIQLLNPDIFVWVRTTEDNQFNYMKMCREACPDAIHIWDTDDAHDVVPTISLHKPFIRFDIAERMIMGIKLCDILSVSTQDLAEHFDRLLGADRTNVVGNQIETRVVPNMFGRDEFMTAQQVTAQTVRGMGKPRIGWGGGMSHTGDLNLLVPVIEHFGERINWVFLGMRPNTNVPIEFDRGVPTPQYNAKLASVNLDLMLAPLESNAFNACKSNLRLLEGAACFYPAVASPEPPYKTNNPPVFAYASTTEQWIEAIEQFINLPLAEQESWGKKMNAWAQEHYDLDARAVQRLSQWLPTGSALFQPRFNTEPAKKISVVNFPVTGGDLLEPAESLEKALETNNDILWMRPQSLIVSDQLKRMKDLLADEKVATISGMTNAGGETGFPKREEYYNYVDSYAQAFNGILKEKIIDVDIVHPNGPAILISRRVINAIGWPSLQKFADKDGHIHEEAALYEWGAEALARGYKNKVANVYIPSTQQCPPFDYEALQCFLKFRYGLENTPNDPCGKLRMDVELAFCRRNYGIVPLNLGNYAEWADIWDTLSKDDLGYIAAQTKLKPSHVEINGQHFYIACEGDAQDAEGNLLLYPTIEYALKASGHDEHTNKWLVVVHGGRLRAHALYMMAHAVSDTTAAVYGDHDVLDKDTTGKEFRRDHDFKPLPFDHDMALARDYVSPVCALRISALDANCFEDKQTGVYAAFLDIVRRYGKKHVVHVPRVLFHQYPIEQEQMDALCSQKCAVAQKQAEQMGWSMSVGSHLKVPIYGNITYKPVNHPKVSIIISTKNKAEMLQPCIDSLLTFTDYDNYEILIIDNGSDNQLHKQYRESLRGHPKIKLLEWNHPFHFSTINNYGVQHADGEYILLLSDETRCVPESRTWLSEMVGCIEREHVGTVGAKLLFPSNHMQHIGMVNDFGQCGSPFHMQPNSPCYNGMGIIPHEVTANTGACLLIKKSLYQELGGLDEALPNDFVDVALGAECIKRGLVNICVMNAILFYLKPTTRTRETLQTWNQPDPYWNRNLSIVDQQTIAGMNYNLYAWPGLLFPWRGQMQRTKHNVLIVGDNNNEMMRRYVAAGDHVYQSVNSGFNLHIVQPVLVNIPPIDVRNPKSAVPVLKELGIDKVVLRSLRGASLETLGFLTALGVDVLYLPDSIESLSPLLDYPKPTQVVIDKEGTPWGQVNLRAWQAVWTDFKAKVEIDLADAPEMEANLKKNTTGWTMTKQSPSWA